MGALQPGMPAPSMLPKNWDLLIVDLKDSIVQAPVGNFMLAREAHARFHQNAKGLHPAYRTTMDETRGMVRACSECAAIKQGMGLGIGVKPRDSNPMSNGKWMP
ncbi:POK18 protein, partial [Zosterops hypoxanthus]|nr:POK18 protein [Zosterops hypoxanthus]